MQNPRTSASVGNGAAASALNVSQPRRTSRIASSGDWIVVTKFDNAETRVFRAAIDAQHPHGREFIPLFAVACWHSTFLAQQHLGRRAFAASFSCRNAA